MKTIKKGLKICDDLLNSMLVVSRSYGSKDKPLTARGVPKMQARKDFRDMFPYISLICHCFLSLEASTRWAYPPVALKAATCVHRNHSTTNLPIMTCRSDLCMTACTIHGLGKIVITIHQCGLVAKMYNQECSIVEERRKMVWLCIKVCG